MLTISYFHVTLVSVSTNPWLCAQRRQISLRIRPVWSESSLSAWRSTEPLATHWAHSKNSDQTGRMPRLIWVFLNNLLKKKRIIKLREYRFLNYSIIQIICQCALTSHFFKFAFCQICVAIFWSQSFQHTPLKILVNLESGVHVFSGVTTYYMLLRYLAFISRCYSLLSFYNK